MDQLQGIGAEMVRLCRPEQAAAFSLAMGWLEVAAR